MYIPPEALEKTNQPQYNFIGGCNKALYRALKLPLHNFSGCLFAESGIASPLCNAVVACSIDAQAADQVVKHVKEYCIEKKLPHSWWLEEREENPMLLKSLSQHGLKSIGDFLGMTLDLHHLKNSPQNTHGLVIAEVEDFTAWGEVIASAFQMEPAVAIPYARLFSNASSNSFVHLEGKIDGNTVSTGTLLLTPQGGYIYNIATQEDKRRQGFATLVLTELLERARQSGCQQVGLLASPLAAGIYTRLGFRRSCLFHIYL